MKPKYTTAFESASPDHREGGKAADAVSYKMRAERQTDAFIVRSALARWVSSWSESWLVEDGVRQFSDLEVEFELAWSPPTFTELQWIVASLPDCHVAAETLMPFEAYTGDRTYDALRRSMTRPTPQRLRLALGGQSGTLEWIQIFTDSLSENLELCSANTT
jgi:hypothetical protein